MLEQGAKEKQKMGKSLIKTISVIYFYFFM